MHGTSKGDIAVISSISRIRIAIAIAIMKIILRKLLGCILPSSHDSWMMWKKIVALLYYSFESVSQDDVAVAAAAAAVVREGATIF